MIQLKPDSICVQLSDTETLPLLAESVVEAICKHRLLSEGLEPWQIEQIARALIHFLREDLHRETIEVGEFLLALSTLMASVHSGPEQSSNVAIASTDLYRMAKDTGCGFELAFFQAIDRSIRDLSQGNARIVRFVGLRSCVKLLVGAKNWGRSCQQLNDEIVAFIRSHMQHRGESAPVAFAVS